MEATARIRHWLAVVPLLAAGVGCAGDGERTSSGSFTPTGFTNSFGRYGQQSQSVSRSQAPVVPAGLPDPQLTPAPVVPLQSQPTTATVVPVSSSEPTPDQAATQVRVVAVIGNDVAITDDEIWQLVRQRADEYVRLTGDERKAKEKEVFREVLRNVIERELILADFFAKLKKNKPGLIDEVRDDAAKSAAKQLRDIRKEKGIGSEDQFTELLRSQGISYKVLRRQFERGTMMQMFLGQLTRDKEKAISLGQIEQYYTSHPDEFQMQDKVKWNHLFVSAKEFPNPDAARKYADDLLAKAKAGQSFAELAVKYGHGTSQLNKGDGIGEQRGKISPTELEPVVFGLTAGQVSDLIPTPVGFHIVKVAERETAGVRPFEEKVQMFIRAKLAAEIRRDAVTKLIEELWRKTTVKIVELP